MPTFPVTGPDGTVYPVKAPDGATKEQAFEFFKQQWDTGKIKPGKIPSQEGIGAVESITTGMGDPIAGGQQLISHITKSPEEAAKVDTQVRLREAQIAQRGGAQPMLRTLGSAITGAPAMAAAGPLGPIAGGAVGGALTSAVQPVTQQGDYWSHKQDDIILGTAFGGGTGAGLSFLGTALGGVSDPAKKALMDSGVKLTPGQIIGGVGRRAEEAFKSFPILGNFIRGAEGRGIEGFNRGVLNQALEPLKGINGVQAKLDPNIPVGRDAMRFAKQQFDAAYTNVLNGTKLQMDHDLARDIGAIRGSSNELGTDLEKQFNTILNNRLAPVLRGTGNVKQAAGDMREFADSFRNGSPSEKLMAKQFEAVHGAIMRAVERQNPQQAQALRKVDYAFAMYARVRDAATRRATSEGVFTPSDLLQSIKSQDKTSGKSSFATGDSLLQVYAQYGQKILPGKMPDSGTPERAMFDAAVFAAKPYYAAALTAASAPWTEAGVNIVNRLATRGPVASAAGSVVRRAAPYGGVVGANYGTQPTADETPQYGGPQQ